MLVGDRVRLKNPHRYPFKDTATPVLGVVEREHESQWFGEWVWETRGDGQRERVWHGVRSWFVRFDEPREHCADGWSPVVGYFLQPHQLEVVA